MSQRILAILIALVPLAIAFDPLALQADCPTPFITISPGGGSVGGGDKVTLRLYDGQYENPLADPPYLNVFFGDTPAASLHLVDDVTVEAITPPHAATGGVVDVVVEFPPNVRITLPKAYQYSGFEGSPRRENFEAVLVPVAIFPVGERLPGANGSSWESELWVHNHGTRLVEFFLGLPQCITVCPGCCLGPFPGFAAGKEDIISGGHDALRAGYLFYAQRGGAGDLSFSLRIADISRQLQTDGTEIPVVRERDFRTGMIDLPDVPLNPRSRANLRVYDPTGNIGAKVTIRIITPGADAPLITDNLVLATRAADNVSTAFPTYAGYASISDLRAKYPSIPEGAYRVEASRTDSTPFWAFVSVTNNDTQHVTIVSPQ
ncbi:MAG TPA: hypothetical protein VEZ11_05065 [Thermoanaerobaculia bacterium]|nr:hypothetical protein [Thermoanaerobaculia bacterium]